LGFETTIADPDVYRRRAVKSNGIEYWELLLVYVDDILVISSDPRSVLNHLHQYYEFSTKGDEHPTRYLGMDIAKVTFPKDDSGQEYWSVSSRTSVRNAVNNVKELLKDEGGLKGTAKTPLPSGYRPELDVSDELNNDMASRYSQLIGILRWMVELGRVDIYYEVSVLAQYLALPRIGQQCIICFHI
jgi:hypothetical protein